MAALERDDEAEQALRKAIELQPTLPEPHYVLGRLLMNGERSDEGKRELEIFKELHDLRDSEDHRRGRIATLNRQGLLLLEQGKPLNAIVLFERAMELGPREGSVHANKALALMEIGNVEGALPLLERAIELGGDEEAFGEILVRARAQIPR